MIKITFPDGNTRDFNHGISGMQIAESISHSLAKSAIAIELDGMLQDLSQPIIKDGRVRIITERDPEALEIIRHDAAHVLAQAVKNLFPDTQVTIGPVIENGFYYDFAREKPFTTDDLQQIEQEMQKIIDAKLPIQREVMSRIAAIEFFKNLGELYKVDIIADIPGNEEIAIYRQGNFADLCRGPHSPHTGFIKAFKLMRVSGAYWRGDSTNQMLQRIYGTAWSNKAALAAYLTMLEEAERRDHRKIGADMDLFHFQHDAPGAVFWHPKGWTLYQTLVQYMRQLCQKHGYTEINTPELLDYSIWVTSGHAEKFAENMFIAHGGEDGRKYALKPMSCPGAIQVFNHSLISYRALPMRMAEFGKVHRYESSGSLHGLMRVRAFTQDDAHVFCSEDQLQDECIAILKFATELYAKLGFDKVGIKISTRPVKRIGSDQIWDKSEAALIQAIKTTGLAYTIDEGDGAFYGPKIDFSISDAIGRKWQMGTVQVDFNLPERFDINYVAVDGNKRRPVMLHRAILGSLERFIGVLLENCAGHLPIWLAPIQVAIATITQEVAEYAESIKKNLDALGVRNIIDHNSETINYKIRQHSNAKIPIILVIGKEEVQNNTVSMRRLGTNAKETIALTELFDKLKGEALLSS